MFYDTYDGSVSADTRDGDDTEASVSEGVLLQEDVICYSMTDSSEDYEEWDNGER